MKTRVMSEEERTLTLRYIKIWERTGKELRKIKMQELAAMTDQQAREDTYDLLMLSNTAYRSPQRKRHSGLVEQQRWFKKIRKARNEHHQSA